jgi:hypothetical protein
MYSNPHFFYYRNSVTRVLHYHRPRKADPSSTLFQSDKVQDWVVVEQADLACGRLILLASGHEFLSNIDGA